MEEQAETPLRERVLGWAEHVRRAALVAAERHYAAETPWFYSSYWIGLPTALLSAIAGVAAFRNFPQVAGYTAILVAALSALNAFLDPKARANQHHRAAKSFEALYHKAGFFHRVLAHRGQPEADDLALVAGMNDELSQLIGASPAIPGRAYERADRNLMRGWGEVARHPDDAGYRPPARSGGAAAEGR
jgi:hypothetical protein